MPPCLHLLRIRSWSVLMGYLHTDVFSFTVGCPGMTSPTLPPLPPLYPTWNSMWDIIIVYQTLCCCFIVSAHIYNVHKWPMKIDLFSSLSSKGNALIYVIQLIIDQKCYSYCLNGQRIITEVGRLIRKLELVLHNISDFSKLCRDDVLVSCRDISEIRNCTF